MIQQQENTPDYNDNNNHENRNDNLLIIESEEEEEEIGKVYEENSIDPKITTKSNNIGANLIDNLNENINIINNVNRKLYKDPHFIDNRLVMVHLMEWRYDDIALECENFLGPNGFAGVQLSPVNEHSILPNRPWYERYQPVSYKINTKSGDEKQLKEMIERANRSGIRVYIDIILNHMTGGQYGYGTAGNYYNGDEMYYPGVPFTKEHFNVFLDKCPTKSGEIEDWDDPIQSRNCNLFGLRDLNQSLDYVRQKQIDFLNKLIDMGVAGFRCDASTHMWPDDLSYIFSKLNNLNENFFPKNSRPFIYHEIIYYGGSGINSTEYLNLGRIIEFRFWKELTNCFRNNNQMKWLKNFGEEWCLVKSDDALVMIDSHDLRVGHNGSLLNFNINCFNQKLLKSINAFMLAWNYGIPRIMSSYKWNQIIDKDGKDINEWMGPPCDNNGNIIKVKQFKNDDDYDDYDYDDHWIYEHRWRQISAMVKFRSIVKNEPIQNWWDNDDYQIAFSRGNRGFIVFNQQTYNGLDLNFKLQTGMKPGLYYDIISCDSKKIQTKFDEINDGSIDSLEEMKKKLENHENGINEKLILVDQDGFADIFIGNDDVDSFQAIHLESKLI